MKEIVIISGKGGTGKTSIAAAFAILGAGDVIVADCDVDAADLHLLLNPMVEIEEDFYSGFVAEIDPHTCIHCGKCREICRFEAIEQLQGVYFANPIDCEGCGYCARICPAKAIIMRKQNVGKLYISKIKTGSQMVHARLRSGADNSGKLVARVKKDAKSIAVENGKQFMIVDGSPGIGCPVVSSLSGADIVVMVTEPTASGIHDLKRVYELVHKFRIPAACIINKADLNPELTNQLEAYLSENGIVHLSNIPYDESFTAAMTLGQSIVEHPPNRSGDIIISTWNKLINNLAKEQT